MKYIQKLNDGFTVIEADTKPVGCYDIEEPTLAAGEYYTYIKEYETDKFKYNIEDIPLRLDVHAFKESLRTDLDTRMGELYDICGSVSDCLEAPLSSTGLSNLKDLMDMWLTSGKFIQTDYDTFVDCFTDYGIDITSY